MNFSIYISRISNQYVLTRYILIRTQGKTIYSQALVQPFLLNKYLESYNER